MQFRLETPSARVRTQRIPIKDRALAVAYFQSYQKLGREGKRFVTSKTTLADLKKAAPSWYVELVGMTGLVRKSLPAAVLRIGRPDRPSREVFPECVPGD